MVLGHVTACAGAEARTPEQELARQTCYLAAESKADLSAAAQCGTYKWEECPARPAIMAELKAAQEACP